MKKGTLVFDIGKTNKKLFVFDEKFQVVFQESKQFSEITDEDGFPMEDLDAIEVWIKASFQRIVTNQNFLIEGVNFSTYGASIVCLDHEGKRCTPFYNYLKPLPDDFQDQFMQKYGPKELFEEQTSGPYLGMLNSGLQLYFLKYYRPNFYQKVKTVLHLPQYLSSLIGLNYVNDYSSLGCHTGLWDYKEKKFAAWVLKEGFLELFPSISTENFEKVNKLRIGKGIHDSTASSLPYIKGFKDSFILISTGTWSVAMKPADLTPIKVSDIKNDTVLFMSPEGTPIKATRLLMGLHYQESLKLFSEAFQISTPDIENIKYDPKFRDLRSTSKHLILNHHLLEPERFGFVNGTNDNIDSFESVEQIIHQLVFEIVDLQTASMRPLLVAPPKAFFIDGGFTRNQIFLKIISNKLKPTPVFKSNRPIGSAMGACLTVREIGINTKEFFELYEIEKI
ncbi:MAG: FGGY family carbohydrate kinase [Paracoccaceae bacterium]|jgi:sugar (pentulose or hexulose) kinase